MKVAAELFGESNKLDANTDDVSEKRESAATEDDDISSALDLLNALDSPESEAVEDDELSNALDALDSLELATDEDGGALNPDSLDASLDSMDDSNALDSAESEAAEGADENDGRDAGASGLDSLGDSLDGLTSSVKLGSL